MFILETLFEKAHSKAGFIKKYEPTTNTLPVFAKIHDEHDSEDDYEAQSSQDASESELSEIEMSPEVSAVTSDF